MVEDSVDAEVVDVNVEDVAVGMGVDVGYSCSINVVVTTFVVGSMSMIDTVRVVGSADTVTVFVTGGEVSTTVVGDGVTVTVRVVSASLPWPPLPSMGTTEYVGRAAAASVGVLFQKKGKADDWLHNAEIAIIKGMERLRCILIC